MKLVSFVERVQKGWILEMHSLNKHTYHFDPNRKAPKQLPSKMLGEYMSDKLLMEGQIMTPKLVQAQLKKEHCLAICDGLALSIHNYATSVKYGDHQDSFIMISSYLRMLEVMNPGTVTDHGVDANTGKFGYIFYALGALKSGFPYARPIIVADGTHLRGKYQGVLFIITKDGNNQIFPLAFGIGNIECDESWKYRMYKFKEVFGCPRDLLIVSDGHKFIANAMKKVFPHAHHELCCYHVQKNLVKYGQHVVAIFNIAAYSYRIEDYNRHRENLQIACPTAATHLKEAIVKNK